VVGFVLTGYFTALTPAQQLSLSTTVAALGPVFFFRFAKGLWTSIVFLGEGLYLDWPNR
jgi:hypothetical protein